MRARDFTGNSLKENGFHGFVHQKPPAAAENVAPRNNALTHQRLADDMAAFQKAGGRIEVLGNTRSLKKIGSDATDAQSAESAGAKK